MFHASDRLRRGKKDSMKRVPRLSRGLTTLQSDELHCSYLELLDTPRALTVWMLYRAGEHRSLVELKFDPSLYEPTGIVDRTGLHRLRCDYAATKYFSKTQGLRTGINTKEIALASAREAEARCRETNERILNLNSGRCVNSKLNTALFRASQIISKILGPLPTSFEDVSFSKGRTTSAYGDEKSRVHKYTSHLDVYPQSLGLALKLVQDSPVWGQAALDAEGPCSVLPRAFEIIQGNVMTVVSKNAKTDRVICYESHCNIRLQLSVGLHIRRRLRIHGIDLNNQSINQRRAVFGSKFGSLATLDLKAASDTVATELVFTVLPVDWACYLDTLRARYTLWPDGEWRKNEKFSSMGNGFTFELESLIFYALCSSITENVSVYGDDIIVPTSSAEEVISLLTDCGFEINTSKSYWTGYFRESCGEDSVCGVNVTPVYLRSLPRRREDVVKLHNSVRKWLTRGTPWLEGAEMLRSWRQNHPHHLGPASNCGKPLGDGHYHVNFDEACPQRAADWVDGWWYKTTIPLWRKNSLYGDRVSGHFSGRYGAAALCATLGPKPVLDVYSSTVDRKQVKYVTIRGLANFVWEDVVWV